MSYRGIRQDKRDELLSEISKMMDKNHGVSKASELYTLGLDYRKLESFVKEGSLRRIRNGYYSMGRIRTPEDELILSMFPDGVLTMQSALYYYGYIEDKPFQWTIAVDKNTSKARFKSEFPSVIPYYTEQAILSLGVTELPFGGGSMKIYEKERLICECFKYEEKLESGMLRSAMMGLLAEKDIDTAKLMEYAAKRKVMSKVRNRIGIWLA